MAKKLVGMLVGIIVGGVFLAVGLCLHGQKKKVQSYLEAAGTVLSSEVASHRSDSSSNRRSTRMYKPEVVYEYEVEGQVYEGGKVAYIERSSSSRGWADEVVGKYRPGESCTVYYDPENPSSSVLIREATGLLAWLPGLLIGVGVVVLVLLCGGGIIWILALAGVVGGMAFKGRRGARVAAASSRGDDIPEMDEVNTPEKGGRG